MPSPDWTTIPQLCLRSLKKKKKKNLSQEEFLGSTAHDGGGVRGTVCAQTVWLLPPSKQASIRRQCLSDPHIWRELGGYAAECVFESEAGRSDATALEYLPLFACITPTSPEVNRTLFLHQQAWAQKAMESSVWTHRLARTDPGTFTSQKDKVGFQFTAGGVKFTSSWQQVVMFSLLQTSIAASSENQLNVCLIKPRPNMSSLVVRCLADGPSAPSGMLVLQLHARRNWLTQTQVSS